MGSPSTAGPADAPLAAKESPSRSRPPASPRESAASIWACFSSEVAPHTVAASNGTSASAPSRAGGERIPQSARRPPPRSLLPSSSSHELVRSRPSTATRRPLARNCAQTSAGCSQGKQDEGIGEHGEHPAERASPVERRGEAARAATAKDEQCGEDAGNTKDERAVRNGIGVLDAFLVDDHIAGNRERHSESKCHVAPLGLAADATDDKDPTPPGRLRRPGALTSVHR